VFTDRVADFSDDEEEFSSNDEGEAEGSDSEPTPEDAMGRRARKAARAKIPTNARVRSFNCFTVPVFRWTFSHGKQKNLLSFHCADDEVDRLFGLVVRVRGYRSGGPGSIPGTTRFSEKEKKKERKK
jgi:hypothetical protein